MMRFLDMEDILQIHQNQLEHFGGSPGIRDFGAIESALAMPQAGMGGDYFHRDIFEMAAAYLFHLAQNHGFVDGNKRVAFYAALVFLAWNDVVVDAEDPKMIKLVLETASGKKDKAAIADFFRKHQIEA
jgi:death-on-curing protein